MDAVLAERGESYECICRDPWRTLNMSNGNPAHHIEKFKAVPIQLSAFVQESSRLPLAQLQVVRTLHVSGPQVASERRGKKQEQQAVVRLSEFYRHPALR
ncbi:hypothetical protein NDU88_005476 [Pleurodeles waltl]|uniref:Uncharacterized protein n=1 Tax=Pleurodeles waltl TaxID=8319 RepID=A0AAV7UI89_PLEWA|nr:hypothetical protein NDU88_005476 [Pleurodeles waltl]